MPPKIWEQGSAEAFSIKPSERGKLKRELHIVQRSAVSCALRTRVDEGRELASGSDPEVTRIHSKPRLCMLSDIAVRFTYI